MEYCDGGNLSNLLNRPLLEETAKSYFIQIVNAVHHLNKLQIIHRDIKPKNLLLSNNQKDIRVCDFGLAKICNGVEQYTVCGSPLYMAPEVICGNSYDYKIDIWSMGIVLYEMLFGINPLSKIKIKKYYELETFMKNTEHINIPDTTISSCAVDLLTQLLDKDVTKRIDLDDIYMHKWLDIDDAFVEINLSESFELIFKMDE